jgi:translation initiation factor 4E
VSSPTGGAATAFGLGSGAFASFGSATRTPKTPGSAFDFSKAAGSTASPSAPLDKKEKPPVGRALSTFTKATTSTTADEGLGGPSVDLEIPWPLKHSWVIWYRPPTSKNSDYEKSTKAMCKMATVQQFWKTFAHLKRPSALPTVSDYHFFKEGIRPVWEDEENKRGGKWIMRLKKGVSDRYWEDLLMAIIGDQFAEAGEEVCGAVLSVRSGEDVFSIWTKNDGGRNIKIRLVLSRLHLFTCTNTDHRETIKRVLSLPADTNIVWKSHDDSITQRTALDHARHEKTGSTDKRRVTLSAEDGNAIKERLSHNP